MSSVVISGDTSGTVTLQAPAVAGTTTLTLPATSGTVVTTATSTGISGSAISTGTVGVSVGGTGANTLTANNVILGNGTSAVQFVAPGSSGNVLTSDGTTWASAAAGGGQFRTELFTTPGTWTKPGSATQVRVTVVGGGAGSAVPTGGTSSPGGTSSFGPAVSATGGSGGSFPAGGAPGTGTVSVGTTLRTGTAINITTHWLLGGVGQGGNTNAVNFPTSGPLGAGRTAAIGTAGGTGGFASAIVPVSAPVTITVGAGGAGAGSPTPNRGGGVGGAILVEFVG